MMGEPRLAEPPGPDGARSVSELGARLRDLQVWAGLSVREIHRRVVRQRQGRGVPELPALDTVHRCLQPGRTRLDRELIVDIARALLGDDVRAAEWREAHHIVTSRHSPAAVVAVRRGLPEPPRAFVGRRAALVPLLVDHPAAPVLVVHGMPGVGKTTLALYAAHELIRRGRYADLQLSVNLHGYGLYGPPADPGVVLDGMLRVLGCPAHAVHGLDLHSRTVRLGQLLAGRRALILLDDAASADQVLPLLSGSRICLTLITSRRRLAELPVQHVSLEPFTGAEARDLLNGVVGAARVAHEPAAAARIADVVGRLPLALTLVAGQIRKTPDWTLQDHLSRLVERRANLSLDKGVAVAIESSVVVLPASQQRLLRLLAIHPGSTVEVHAAAALARSPLRAVTRDLDALVRDSLLARRAPGRFEMHAVIRVYAAERASDVDAPKSRSMALTRVFDYYRFVGYQAARLLAPHYVRPMELARPGTALPALADRRAATAWLDSERQNLITCALYCAGHDRPRYTSDLASLLHHYLYTTGHLHDMEQLDRRASQVASGIDGARALGRLGTACSWLGRLAEAREHYRRALAVIEAHGDLDLKARWLANHGILCRRLGQFDEAISNHQQAMTMFLDRGDESLAGQQLSNLGYLYVLIGRHGRGVEALRRALTIAQATSDRIGEATALGNLAFAALMAERFRAALDRYERALRILMELGDRAGECAARNGCGSARTALGEPEQGLEHHRLALRIARQIGDREGEAEALIEGGRALHHVDRLDEALDWHGNALRLAERTGNAWQQARAHDGIACARAVMDDLESARVHWQHALALQTAMRTIDADRVAHRLASVTPTGSADEDAPVAGV